MDDKTRDFFHFCDKLIERYSELWVTKEELEDFWRLWVMKMLFFSVVAMNNSWQNQIIDEEIFNNFWALPNGPAESDCYNEIYTEYNSEFENKLRNREFRNISPKSGSIIELMVKSIPTILFTKTTFELVQISHRFGSWINAYKEAVQNNRKASKMNNDLIKWEDIFLAVI